MKLKKPKIRFWVGVMIFFSTYINYAFRVNMSVSIMAMVNKPKSERIAECKLKEQESNMDNSTDSTNITSTVPPQADYGTRYTWDNSVQLRVVAGYFYGYIFGCIPAGSLAELMGPYPLVLVAQMIPVVLNSLTVYAAMAHWSLVFIIRFVIGFCGGLVYPGLQVLIARWAPPKEKGKFIGALMGNTLGTCVTWPLVGFVTEKLGTSWGFHVVSAQGIIYGIVFFFLVSNSPATHKWITEEEKNYISESQGGTVSSKKSVAPYKAMFKSLPFWALNICHFGNVWGLYLQLTSAPKFLENVLGFDLKSSGALAALPPLGRLICGFMFGSIGDVIRRKELMTVTKTRKVFIIFSHLIPSAALFLMITVGCNWIGVVILLILAQAINSATVLTNLQNAQDLAPNYAGSIFGVISFFGGLAGFINPELAGFLTRNHNGLAEWRWFFIIGGCVYSFCGIFFIFFGTGKTQPWNEKKEVEET